MENKKQKVRKQPIKYWLVDITLTSGENLQFYVKAIDKFEAYRKADEYATLAENEKLKTFMEEFKLLP